MVRLEIFYRKKSIVVEDITTHKANESLKNKNPDNPKVFSRFDYDIVKDRRYTLDKFQFHVPITMNFKAPLKTPTDRKFIQSFNSKINRAFIKQLSSINNINIIGIDRGERHLLYYTLINRDGQILKQDSLNVIANEKQKVNYHGLLVKKEGDRIEERKEWGVIENIKDLKEGYLSQVIHYLTNLMITHNAIIAIEDLNSGFKRGRQKVEKQVYQKFEKMLIEKLNYLADKGKEINETGGLLKAYQLTGIYDSGSLKMQKQSGCLFYVPSWNTSKIDPATGFVDFLKPVYVNLQQAKEFFNKFDSVHFNYEKDYFEFAFDYRNFTGKAEGGRTRWVVCTTNEERFVWNKSLNNSKGGQERYDVTGKIKALFDANGIAYEDGMDLKPQISKQDSKDFFITLMKALEVTLALRYNNGEKGGREQDYILSPVADSRGRFFDSRKADATMPQNADANGAYHIALKGLWCLEQIRKTTDFAGVKLAISNKEWLQFKQSKVL
jgi:CRISPR-associated protein Cpf1